jgi:hypothetical protein
VHWSGWCWCLPGSSVMAMAAAAMAMAVAAMAMAAAAMAAAAMVVEVAEMVVEVAEMVVEVAEVVEVMSLMGARSLTEGWAVARQQRARMQQRAVRSSRR